MIVPGSDFITSADNCPVFENELFLQTRRSIEQVFAAAQQEVLAQCGAALQSVIQARELYKRDIDAMESPMDMHQMEGGAFPGLDIHAVLLRQRQFRLLRYKWEQLQDDDEPLLKTLQRLIEEQQYNEVIRLAEEYRKILELTESDMLKQLHSEPYFQSVKHAVSRISTELTTTLNKALEHIDNFWFKGDDTHDEAQYLLKYEVLTRYPAHPKAFEVQQGWAEHDIKQGLEQDIQDYAETGNQIQALQDAFWSADEAEQAWAVETAHNLDLDALITSLGLERAAAAVEHLAALSPSSDLTLQQTQHDVREQQIRRQLLRLRGRLYRNDLGGFDTAMHGVQEPGLLLQDVRKLGDEYAAVAKMNEALVAFENGDWQKTWAAALVARSNYPDAPRIDALIERTKNAPHIEISLVNQIRQTLSDLLQLEETPDMTGNNLVKINTQIQEIKSQIDQYIYFARNYTGQYMELLERYQTAWQQAATYAFEHRRLSVTDDARAIEELERLVCIAPLVPAMESLIHVLQGRIHILQTRQLVGAAYLNQAEEHIRTATSMLPPDDQLLQEVRDILRQKSAFVDFSRHQATTYEQQHELSKAHHSIDEALANNKEDQKAEAIRVRLEAEMAAVQELARQATALEQKDLPRSSALWQEVCRRHTDGVYPSANTRSFIELQNDVKQRIETSHQHIANARMEFQTLRNWLAPQRRPVWPDFNHYCQQVLAHLSAVEPGMRQEQLSRIEAAIHLLERYRDAYQQLEQFLDPTSDQTVDRTGREQAIGMFQTIWADICAFESANDALLEVLATSVQVSYDRMDRLIRYI